MGKGRVSGDRGFMLTKKLFAPLIGTVVTITTGLLGEYGFNLIHKRILDEQRNKVISEIGQLRSDLESQLNGTPILQTD